jgi:nicotinate-nucleotide adenylyltransferase
MRIGLYGGTFDPVHLAHLVLAEQCREQLALDEVWFIPAASPPHKSGVTITEAKHRVAMLELAIAGHASFKLSRLELERTGPSYTVETLRQLRHDHSGVDFFLLLGGDSIRDFTTWREPQEIARLATLVAVNRGAAELADIPTDIAAPESRCVVQMPAIDISASDLRQRVATGRGIRYLVPRAVEQYIQQHGLYLPTAE